MNSVNAPDQQHFRFAMLVCLHQDGTKNGNSRQYSNPLLKQTPLITDNSKQHGMLKNQRQSGSKMMLSNAGQCERTYWTDKNILPYYDHL